MDVAPYLSVITALDFCVKLGGLDRIMNYNHDLAVRGGLAAARILGTNVMDGTAPLYSQTGAMTNLRLPVIKSKVGSNAALWLQSGAESWFFQSLLNEFKTVIPVFEYTGVIWARFSAQVWLEVSDFEYGARALLTLCERVNQGSAPNFLDGQ